MEERDIREIAAMAGELFSVPWTMADFRKAFHDPNYLYYVADIREKAEESDNRIIGFAGLLLTGEEADLVNIAVRKKIQGRGTGCKLLQSLISGGHRLGVQKIFLEVRESNVPARALYEKNGFVVAGRRKKYYSRPEEDALVMMKEIKNV